MIKTGVIMGFMVCYYGTGTTTNYNDSINDTCADSNHYDEQCYLEQTKPIKVETNKNQFIFSNHPKEIKPTKSVFVPNLFILKVSMDSRSGFKGKTIKRRIGK